MIDIKKKKKKYDMYQMMIDIEIYLSQGGLYFMVQWFYLITERLFDGEMSYLDYNFHVTRWLT